MPEHRLILHIGTKKTATTTLQTLLKQQAEGLAKQGYLYPRTDREPFPHPTKQAFFGRTLAKAGKAARQMYRDMMEEFTASGCHAMVISEEGLSGAGFSRDLSAMKFFARDFAIEVICYLRRKDYFAESFWNQRCKMGVETRSIDEFIEQESAIRHMTYCDILDRWSAVGKVSAIEFDAARATGIVPSFCKATGMVLPEPELARNVSPSMTIAAALAAMNRTNTAPHRWEALEPLLGPDARKHALGSRLRAKLLARFAEHNETLFKTYGVRFAETMPEEGTEPIAVPGPDEVARLVESTTDPSRQTQERHGKKWKKARNGRA